MVSLRRVTRTSAMRGSLCCDTHERRRVPVQVDSRDVEEGSKKVSSEQDVCTHCPCVRALMRAVTIVVELVDSGPTYLAGGVCEELRLLGT